MRENDLDAQIRKRSERLRQLVRKGIPTDMRGAVRVLRVLRVLCVLCVLSVFCVCLVCCVCCVFCVCCVCVNNHLEAHTKANRLRQLVRKRIPTDMRCAVR